MKYSLKTLIFVSLLAPWALTTSGCAGAAGGNTDSSPDQQSITDLGVDVVNNHDTVDVMDVSDATDATDITDVVIDHSTTDLVDLSVDTTVDAADSEIDANECASGLTMCSGLCRDTTRDFYNCGQCGRSCNRGEMCEGSSCVPGCYSSDDCDNGLICGATPGCGIPRVCERPEVQCGACGCMLPCQAPQVACGCSCITPCGPNEVLENCRCIPRCTDTSCAVDQVCNSEGHCQMRICNTYFDCGPGGDQCILRPGSRTGTCVRPSQCSALPP